MVETFEAVYVDDLAILGKDESKIEDFKRNINKRFKTKDLGLYI